VQLLALPYRSLQVGLSGQAVDGYVNEWITALTDVTTTVHSIHELLRAGDDQTAAASLPTEWPYPLTAQTAAIIAASAPPGDDSGPQGRYWTPTAPAMWSGSSKPWPTTVCVASSPAVTRLACRSYSTV
jgi:Domain of unknown function (DUF4291)